MTTGPREFELREFEPQDLAEVLRLEAASFPYDAYPERVFRHWHRMHPRLFLVATPGDRGTGLVGYVLGSVEPGLGDGASGHEMAARGRILSIAVDPGQRGRGVAKALCDRLLERLEGEEVEVVDLEVRVDNLSAIRLWRSLGFRETGVLPGYYHDQGDGLSMRREVSAERGSADLAPSRPTAAEPG